MKTGSVSKQAVSAVCVAILAAALIGSTAARSFATENTSIDRTYYFGFPNDAELNATFLGFAKIAVEELRKDSGVNIEIKMCDSTQDCRDKMKSGEVDFAVVEDTTYINMYSDIADPFLTYSLSGKKTHSVCVFIRTGSNIYSLRDLRGKEIQKSGFRYLKLIMMENGFYEPLTEYFRGFSNILSFDVDALIKGDIDFIVRWDDMTDVLFAVRPVYKDRIAPLRCAGNFTNPPFIVRKGVPNEVVNKVGKFMVGLPRNPAFSFYNSILKPLSFKVVRVSDADYFTLREFEKMSDRERWDEEERWMFFKYKMQDNEKAIGDGAPTSEEAPANSAPMMQLAEKQAKSGNILKAIETYEKLLEMGKSDKTPFGDMIIRNVPLKISELYRMTGSYGRAEDLLVDETKKYPDESRAWELLAANNRDMGNLNEALSNIQKAIAIDKNNPNLYKTLGEIYIHSGDMGAARDSFLKWSKMIKGNGYEKGAAYRRLLDFYMNEYNDLDLAEKTARTIIDVLVSRENAAWARFDLAQTLFQKAAADEETMLHILYMHHSFFYSKYPNAMALASMGYFSKIYKNDDAIAETFLNRAMAESPKCVECLIFKWEAFSPETAKARCEKAIEISPSGPESIHSYSCLANIAYEAKDYSKATHYFKIMHSLSVKTPPQKNEIISYYLSGDVAAAESLMTEAEKNNWWRYTGRRYEDTAIGEIEIYMKAGKTDLANEAYSNYSTYWRYGTAGHIIMGKELARIGKLDQAIEKVQTAVRINPYKADNQCLLSMYLFKKGEYEKSEKAMMDAIKLNNRNPYYYFEMGNMLEGRGKSEEAKEMYEKAKSIDSLVAIKYKTIWINRMK